MINAQDLAEEFGDGCSNEFQRAFEVSRMSEHRVDISDKIAAMVAAGRFVVTTDDYVHCRYTDAVLFSQENIAGDFASRAEAEAKADELSGYCDGGLCVYPRLPVVALVPVFDSEIGEQAPF